MVEGVARGTVDLRHAPQGVVVLHATASAVRLPDRAAPQKAPKVRGGGGGSRVRPRRDDPGIEGGIGSAGSIEGRRADQIRHTAQRDRAMESQPADRDRHLNAVDQREPFLGSERDRADPRPPQRVRRPQEAPPNAHVAFSDQAERQVREGGEVSGCADGALGRDDRQDVGPEHGKESLDRGHPDPGVAARERIRTQRHHRPHGAVLERSSDSRRVAADQVALERLDLIGRDGNVGESPEPGGHPVDPGATAHGPIDDATGCRHRAPRRGREGEAGAAVRRGLEIGERQAVSGEAQYLHRGPILS